jgi:hypothetical protein
MLKRILTVAAVALSITACGVGTAHAQQQTALLISQIPFQGQNKTFDLATAKKITFVTGYGQYVPAVVTDHDGVQRSGSISMSKLLANPLWKGYIGTYNPLVFINTVGANFDCVNWQTVISWAGRAPEVINDNCDLLTRIRSQSDTN